MLICYRDNPRAVKRRQTKMTVLTVHGVRRARARVSLRIREIVDLLEEGKFLPLGIESGTSREHRLFYSAPDGYWFVAVYDVKTREVVTVLPVDYHNRWEISQEALLLARRLVIGKEEPEEPREPEEVQPALTPVRRYIRVFANLNTKGLWCAGRIPANGFNCHDLEVETGKPALKTLVKDLLRSKVGYVPSVAYLRASKRGKMVIVRLDDC